jgi:hypothetical protein
MGNLDLLIVLAHRNPIMHYSGTRDSRYSGYDASTPIESQILYLVSGCEPNFGIGLSFFLNFHEGPLI